MITIKDMAGLIDPATSGELIRALKTNVGIPINLHTHCTPGFGVASVLMAMVNGVDIVDTVILNLSGGPAAPAFEIVQLFADKLGHRHRRRQGAPSPPSTRSSCSTSAASSAQFDQYKMIPRPSSTIAPQAARRDRALFDRALAARREGGARPAELLQSYPGRSRSTSTTPPPTRSCA